MVEIDWYRNPEVMKYGKIIDLMGKRISEVIKANRSGISLYHSIQPLIEGSSNTSWQPGQECCTLLNPVLCVLFGSNFFLFFSFLSFFCFILPSDFLCFFSKVLLVGLLLDILRFSKSGTFFRFYSVKCGLLHHASRRISDAIDYTCSVQFHFLHSRNITNQRYRVLWFLFKKNAILRLVSINAIFQLEVSGKILAAIQVGHLR